VVIGSKVRLGTSNHQPTPSDCHDYVYNLLLYTVAKLHEAGVYVALPMTPRLRWARHWVEDPVWAESR